MGIPGFFRWVSERYPSVNQACESIGGPEFDYLYLDANGIVHSCTHGNSGLSIITEREIFDKIFNRLDIIFDTVRPHKLFYIAIDGVAPRAKMNQQRERRFRNGRERFEELQTLDPDDTSLENAFDSTAITPGTSFMVNLQKALEYYIQYKINFDDKWKNIEVILSGHQVPGEGEHKILEYIRHLIAQPKYNTSSRHCMYGLDADLIMLSLLTHQPNFSLLREEVVFGNAPQNEMPTYTFLHIGLLREYLKLDFFGFDKSLLSEISNEYERVFDDFIILCFCCGNDFVPHLPTLDVSKGSVHDFFKIYQDNWDEIGGYISNCGIVDMVKLKRFLNIIAVGEINVLKGRVQNELARIGNLMADEDTGAVKIGDKEFVANYANMEVLLNSEDPLLFRRVYYQLKFGWDVETPEGEKNLIELVHQYEKAIHWIGSYYYSGCIDWSWFYPYHYAPLAYDVARVEPCEPTFDLESKPWLPYYQLMAVLSPFSVDLLPDGLKSLMNEDSEIGDLYPTDFKIDMDGEKQSWKGVVLLPFLDTDRFMRVVTEGLNQLSEHELLANRHGPTMRYEHKVSTNNPKTIVFNNRKPFVANNSMESVYNLPVISDNSQSNSITQDSTHPFVKGIRFAHYMSAEVKRHIGFPSLNQSNLVDTVVQFNKTLKIFQYPVRSPSMNLQLGSSFFSNLIKSVDNHLNTRTESNKVNVEKHALSLLKPYMYSVVWYGYPYLVPCVILGFNGQKFYTSSDKLIFAEGDRNYIRDKYQNLANVFSDRRNITLKGYKSILTISPVTSFTPNITWGSPIMYPAEMIYESPGNCIINETKFYYPLLKYPVLQQDNKEIGIIHGYDYGDHVQDMNCLEYGTLGVDITNGDLCMVVSDDGDDKKIEIERFSSNDNSFISKCLEKQVSVFDVVLSNLGLRIEFHTTEKLARKLKVSNNVIEFLLYRGKVKWGGITRHIGLDLFNWQFKSALLFTEIELQKKQSRITFSNFVLDLLVKLKEEFEDVFIEIERRVKKDVVLPNDNVELRKRFFDFGDHVKELKKEYGIMLKSIFDQILPPFTTKPIEKLISLKPIELTQEQLEKEEEVCGSCELSINSQYFMNEAQNETVNRENIFFFEQFLNPMPSKILIPAKPAIGDTVINVSGSAKVPIGTKGIIIGIHNRSALNLITLSNTSCLSSDAAIISNIRKSHIMTKSLVNDDDYLRMGEDINLTVIWEQPFVGLSNGGNRCIDMRCGKIGLGEVLCFAKDKSCKLINRDTGSVAKLLKPLENDDKTARKSNNNINNNEKKQKINNKTKSQPVKVQSKKHLEKIETTQKLIEQSFQLDAKSRNQKKIFKGTGSTIVNQVDITDQLFGTDTLIETKPKQIDLSAHLTKLAEKKEKPIVLDKKIFITPPTSDQTTIASKLQKKSNKDQVIVSLPNFNDVHTMENKEAEKQAQEMEKQEQEQEQEEEEEIEQEIKYDVASDVDSSITQFKPKMRGKAKKVKKPASSSFDPNSSLITPVILAPDEIEQDSIRLNVKEN
eukprot:TRINITY_DN3216_c1_g9_i1.p1 TRINITY_DN3216_c1_g9~~TRINITY_DN3216_c1_g9_i1.p1  ORF type:complete len:1514 (+),score=458.70 TRINITY_DN3216_c1_g9_i1:55-4596(+)